jgi:hypothetical protein
VADSPVFDRSCDELEARTALDRLAARGTVRLALKEAGLEVTSVDAAQMGVVLQRVLPSELERRGVADAASVCAAIAEVLAGTVFDVARDRAGEAAAKVARLGS